MPRHRDCFLPRCRLDLVGSYAVGNVLVRFISPGDLPDQIKDEPQNPSLHHHSHCRPRHVDARALHRQPDTLLQMNERYAKKILDACCGGRMFWFDKENPETLYIDNRRIKPEKLANGQTFEIAPESLMDFRKMSLKSESFHLIVFDPPHLSSPGRSSWMRKKYGALDPVTWKTDLRQGFSECFRVLKPNGVLIFKWNEHQIPVSEILKLAPYRPLFGHTSGRSSRTKWIAFMKTPYCRI